MNRQLRRLSGILCTMLIVFVFSSVQAQDNMLNYGDEIEAELTTDVREITYTFTGAAQDVIVIEMRRTSYESDVDSPLVRLVAPDGSTLADVEGIGSSVVGAVLPEDGDYTIHAGGAEADDLGTFYLRLIQPERLTNNSKFQGQITSESPQFYMIDTALPFTLNYFKEGGDFQPEITVNTIIDDPEDYYGIGSLDPIAVLNGSALTRGSIGIDSVAEVYFVRIDRARFSVTFGDPEAVFTLTLEVFE